MNTIVGIWQIVSRDHNPDPPSSLRVFTADGTYSWQDQGKAIPLEQGTYTLKQRCVEGIEVRHEFDLQCTHDGVTEDYLLKLGKEAFLIRRSAPIYGLLTIYKRTA